MSSKIPPSVIWLLIGIAIGGLLGRLWRGEMADAALMLVAVLLIAFVAYRFVSSQRKAGESSPESIHADDSIAEPSAPTEPFDANPRGVFARRGSKLILRLRGVGRLRFIEFALTLPEGLTWPRATTQPTLAPLPRAPSLTTLARQAMREHPYRAGLLALAFGLTIFVLLFLLELEVNADHTLVVILWLLAFVVFAIAVVPLNMPKWTRRAVRWPIALTVIGIVLLALALRIWEIGSIPFSLGGDEASQGLEALRVIRGDVRSPFVTGWYGVPTMSFYFNSLTLRWFGANITALRLPWALVGAASVLATFGLAARLAGPRLGLLTAALVAVYHYHIHFSRLGSNQIADPLFAALALFFFYRAVARRRAFDWVMLGAVTAGSLYFYAGARLTIILILAVAAYEFWRAPRRFWQAHRASLLIALGAFLIVGAPMLQYAWRFSDEFNARINQIGIFQSGWLALAMRVRGESAVEILFDQFRRAALAFNYYPDRTVWYGLPEPLLDPIFGVLFLLGLGYATMRALLPPADRRLFPMVAWWWGAMILGGMLTESPPSSMRLVTLTVPVCFFIALALWKIARLARKALAGVSVNALLTAALVLFALLSLKTYFLDYAPQRIYGGSRAQAATMLAPVLRDLAPTRIYFVGAPFMYWGFATLPFLVPDAPAVDITEPITAPPPRELVPAGQSAVFIFLAERGSELAWVRQTFPQGDLQEIISPASDQLLALVYVVSP